jgi:hypothetical protein
LPPYFPYMLAFALWVALACLVWIAAALLLIAPKTRPIARSLGLAMAATFPAVWLFQILAAPVVVAILLIAALVWRILQPGLPATTDNPVVIGTFIAAVLVDFVIVAGMSLVGFYEGWRAGWWRARGRGWLETIQQGPSAKLVRSLRHRMSGETVTSQN